MTMKKIMLAFFASLALSPALPAMAQRTETIAAVVNDDAVTLSDVAARMRLIMASSGMPDTDEVRARIAPQILNMLIDESLIRQEAGRLKITVTDEEVKQGFAALAAQNKFTPDQFTSILAKSRIPMSALTEQIRSQIAWSKVIQKKVRPQIDITDGQVDAALQKIKSTEGQTEYLVAEIFLPVDSPQQDQSVKQLADRLARELASGKAPFPAVAAQFSQSASASRGGDMGWVQGDQLPEAIARALVGMKQGEIRGPVRSLTGYHLLLLRNSRTITAETLPSRDDVRQRIGMEQLDRAQRRYLLDLKSAAFIERRA